MINYSVTKCKNPGKNAIEGTTYYHAKAIKTSDYSFEDLAEDINNSTTVTQADAMAVLRSMKPFITRALLAGQAVVLNDLGRLQVGIQGKCFSQDAMSASDFSPATNITGHKILFRPEVSLKKAVASGISLKRVPSEAMA